MRSAKVCGPLVDRRRARALRRGFRVDGHRARDGERVRYDGGVEGFCRRRRRSDASDALSGVGEGRRRKHFHELLTASGATRLAGHSIRLSTEASRARSRARQDGRAAATMPLRGRSDLSFIRNARATTMNQSAERNRAQQGSGSHAGFLDHQDRRDHARRDRRRYRDHDAELGLSRRLRAVPCRARHSGDLPDRGEAISPVAVLGDDRRIDHVRHHHGRLRRSLARHRLHRRIDAAAGPARDHAGARGTARRERSRSTRSARRASRRSTGPRSPSRRRSAPRSATGSPTPAVSATKAARWCSARRSLSSRRFISGPTCRAWRCSGPPSS